MTTEKQVSPKLAEQVLQIFAECMRKYVGGQVPTGRDASHSGTGPMLNMTWDWPTEPTPTILLEGGVSDSLPGYGIGGGLVGEVQECIDERKLPIFIEPYASFAVCLYYDDSKINAG